MLEHAFRWAKLVRFHLGKDNWRSRKAMEKIGGKLFFEGPWSVNGVARDHAFYKIEVSDWNGALARRALP